MSGLQVLVAASYLSDYPSFGITLPSRRSTCICIILSSTVVDFLPDIRVWLSCPNTALGRLQTSAQQDCPAGRQRSMASCFRRVFGGWSQHKIRKFNLILRNAWALKNWGYLNPGTSWRFLIDFESRLCLTNASSAITVIPTEFPLDANGFPTFDLRGLCQQKMKTKWPNNFEMQRARWS